MTRSSFLPITLLGSLLLATAACTDGPADGDRPTPLLVFAATSLTDAFADLEVAFEAAHPGIDIRVSVAASPALREQILEGAPADIYASADTATMTPVAAAGLVVGDPAVFAANTIQIGVPTGNPAGVIGIEDFDDPSLLIGLCAEQVPCGRAGREALANAGIEAAADTHEPNVRALLTKIETAELDAGLVYATDVRSSAQVEGIEIPPQWAVESQYLIAVLSESGAPEAAAIFVDFVLSPEGRSVLAAHGFLVP